MDNALDEPDTTDWCVGGCKKWSETPKGIELYNKLHKLYLESKKYEKV